MSLNIGIDSCFYDGMSSVARVGLGFVFPVYLFGILLTITIMNRFNRPLYCRRVFVFQGYSILLCIANATSVNHCNKCTTCTFWTVKLKTLFSPHFLMNQIRPDDTNDTGLKVIAISNELARANPRA